MVRQDKTRQGDLQVEDKTPTFKRHPDTERLIRHLQTVKVGDFVTYDDLSSIIGRDIRENRGLLETARNALSEDRFFFLTERGEGVYRGTDKEWFEEIDSKTRRHVKRTARKANKRLGYVVSEELAPEDRTRLAMAQTILGMHEALERPKAQKAITMLCDAEGQRLQIKQAAEALKGIF